MFIISALVAFFLQTRHIKKKKDITKKKKKNVWAFYIKYLYIYGFFWQMCLMPLSFKKKYDTCYNILFKHVQSSYHGYTLLKTASNLKYKYICQWKCRGQLNM